MVSSGLNQDQFAVIHASTTQYCVSFSPPSSVTQESIDTMLVEQPDQDLSEPHIRDRDEDSMSHDSASVWGPSLQKVGQ